jgi:hypothetical protein
LNNSLKKENKFNKYGKNFKKQRETVVPFGIPVSHFYLLTEVSIAANLILFFGSAVLFVFVRSGVYPIISGVPYRLLMKHFR